MADERGMTARRVIPLVAALLALASCTTTPVTAPPESRWGRPAVVADGLAAPWSIAFHEGTPLISERDTARIVELSPTGDAREIGTIAGVEGTGEGGLLGIAVRGEHLYAYFTAGEENRIERYELTGGAGALRLGPPRVILGGIPAAGNHNGGRIAFGPDGMLYATTGDAQVRNSAQDLGSLAGKILRMTPDGGVPPDNPFPGSLVLSYGHRNAQGIAWSASGTMYATEFGQNTWDELNIIEPGGNYGWPEVEGIAHRDEFVDPVQQWSPADASPSGMTIAGDTAYVANLRGERIREIPLAAPATSVEHYTGEFGRLRDVVLAPDGKLWILTNNTDSRGDPRPGDDHLLSTDPA
ncbi:PQQ-dependent sugar dehydrogenase [Saccharopolyspora kobensis]|nr:PQQ-dependent sugar dehydrogenase [Saccharopolyspora kobensis]